MEKENVLPLVLKVMEKTIGYELEGYNPETGRWIHSMRDGGAEFADEEMDKRKSQWEEILMKATGSKTKEDANKRIAEYAKFLNDNDLSVGDGFFTNYKAWKTDDMPSRCKLCSHGHCMLELSQGKTPSCEGYEDREKWVNNGKIEKEKNESNK